MFGLGDGFLKYKRTSLIRPQIASCSWKTVICGWSLAFAALISTIVKNVHVVEIFSLYFIGAASIVAVMFTRILILKMILYCSSHCLKYRCVTCCLGNKTEDIEDCIEKMIMKINTKCVVFFTKRGEIWQLNKAVQYIMKNEHSAWIKFVHAFEKRSEKNKKIADNVRVLDRIYPKHRIDCVLVQGIFGAKLIRQISRHFSIPTRHMFIACPSRGFEPTVADLGGVRVITKSI